MMDPRRKAEIKLQILFYKVSMAAIEYCMDYDVEPLSEDTIDSFKSYSSKRIQELEMELEGI